MIGTACSHHASHCRLDNQYLYRSKYFYFLCYILCHRADKILDNLLGLHMDQFLKDRVADFLRVLQGMQLFFRKL